jgi:hypothetical protein
MNKAGSPVMAVEVDRRTSLRADALSLHISNTIAWTELTFFRSRYAECAYTAHDAECVVLHQCLHCCRCSLISRYDPPQVHSLAARLEYLLVTGLQTWNSAAHTCCRWCATRLKCERVKRLCGLCVGHVVAPRSLEQADPPRVLPPRLAVSVRRRSPMTPFLPSNLLFGTAHPRR